MTMTQQPSSFGTSTFQSPSHMVRGDTNFDASSSSYASSYPSGNSSYQSCASSNHTYHMCALSTSLKNVDVDNMRQCLREMQTQISDIAKVVAPIATQSTSSANVAYVQQEKESNRVAVICQICNKHGHTATNCYNRYKPKSRNNVFRDSSKN
jgi:hypothetical protein